MAGRFDVVAYLKLFRFPLVFTAIADSAAGCLLVRWPGMIQGSVLALLAVSSAGLYFFGMALNDIADREKDKASAPGRVLPSGRLSLRAARSAAVLALLISLGAVVAISPVDLLQRIAFWLLTVLAICAYNLFLKFPPVMGLVRAFNLLLGAASAGDTLGMFITWALCLLALPMFVYVTSLTYASTLEDVGPDRTRLAFAVAGMALGALLAAGLAPVFNAVDGWSAASGAGRMVKSAMKHWQGFVFATPLVAWLLRRAWAARDKKGIMLLIRDGVGGIILLDAAFLASGYGLTPAVYVAALVIPAAVSVAIFKRLA